MAALEFADATERQHFLDTACGDNAELRNRVSHLLQLEEQSRDFLEPPPPAVTTPEFPTPQPGQPIGYFGDYILLDEIARGASGVVFRARQSSLNRVVALKMLRAQPLLTNDDDLRRFRAEAQAAAGLDHPGIVPIYEVGEHEGQGYFSMKFIEGGTLHFRAGEFREPRAAAALIAKVARAVHHAHERGILHRDLKPGNILINRDGEPLVVDFGIARHIGLESDLTHTGQIVGTPHYMAPEQAGGSHRTLTPAADIYSLGAILYELLAGRKLFDGETMLTLLRQVTEQVPAPLRIGDKDLESIVMRCLEKQPDARYGSASAMANDLDRWLGGERVKMPARSWSRRRFAYAALAVGAAIIFWKVNENRPHARTPGPAGESGQTAAVKGTRALDEEVQYYRIRNVRSNKVLGIDNGLRVEEGAPVIQLVAGPKERQQWFFVKEGDFYKIINRGSGLALTVGDASMEEGASVLQMDATNTRPNQQWTLQKTDAGYVFTARHSGHVLDVVSGDTARKARIIQYSFADSDNQKFRLDRVNATNFPDPM